MSSNPAPAKGAAKGRQTQWATQFLAAAELVRRGYTVSFTMGNNTPIADLIVGTPGGKAFWVDVKGLSSKSPWLVKPKESQEALYYVLVYLAPLANAKTSRQPDRFFVLTQNEVNALEENYRRNHPTGKHTNPGFEFREALAFEDKWATLPAAW